MVQFIVRSGGFRRFAETNGSSIVLDQPTDISLNLSANQIASMARTGDNLVLQLINGEQVVLQDFFVTFVGGAQNRLFLSNNGEIQEITFEETFGRMNTAEFQTAAGNGDLMFDGGANLGVETQAQVVAAPSGGAAGGLFAGGTMALAGGGIVLAGVGALASGGGSSSNAPNPEDTIPPAVPVIETNNATGVSGTAEPGSTVTVDVNGDGIPDYEQVVGADGTFSIVFDPILTNGEQVVVIVTDGSGNASDPLTVTIDTIAPAAPVVVNAELDEISGTAEAGSTISIDTNNDGVADYTVITGSNGSWSIPFTPPLAENTQISITATDAAGNVSIATSFVVDTVDPGVATVGSINADGVTGTAEAGATVSISIAGGDPIQVPVDDNGDYFVPFSPPVADGVSVVVTVIDPSGNPSNPISVTVDAVAPVTPATTFTGPTSANGTGAEPGATVFIDITNDGIPDGSVVVAADGSWSVDYSTFNPAPNGPLLDGATVNIVLQDSNGNANASGSFQVDATAPTGSVLSNTPTTLTVDVSEAVTLTVVVNGVATNVQATLSGQGSHTLSIPAGTYSDGDTVTLSMTDNAGNSGGSAGYTVDLATINPNILVSSGSEISGLAEANATVVVQIDGVAGSFQVTANGSGVWTLTEATAGVSFSDGLGFTAYAQDTSSNVSQTVNGQISTAPIVSGINTSETGPNAGVITGTVGANEQVQVIYIDGNNGGHIVNDLSPSQPAAADGSWSVTTNPVIEAGEDVYVGVLDGSPSTVIDGNQVLDLTYTLVLQGDAEILDLAVMQLSANENSSDVAYGLQNLDIGAIDLSGNAGNSIIVNQASIAALSDEGDSLRVDGVVGNTIEIEGGIDTGETTMINGEEYMVYDMGNNVSLYVDHDITVI